MGSGRALIAADDRPCPPWVNRAVLAASQERQLRLYSDGNPRHPAQLGEPRFAPLGDKEHLADVASILDKVMRLRRIIKLEARCHLRSDDTACRKLH